MGARADAQPLGTASPPCRDASASDLRAQAAREAVRAGDQAAASRAWQEAIELCPSPDLFEGLGRAFEGIATTALADTDRLQALENALRAYREAVQRAEASPLRGYSPERARTRAVAIEPVVTALRERIAAAPPHPAPAAPVAAAPRPAEPCPGGCGAGASCIAGVCRPHARAPTLPWTLLLTGGALLVFGGAMLGVGLVAQGAATRDTESLTTGGCDVSGTSATCLRYPDGATRPADVAAWATPVGGVTLAVGVVGVAVGAVLLATRPGRAEAEPALRVSTFVAPGGGGVGLGGWF